MSENDVTVIACNGKPWAAYDSRDTAYLAFRSMMLENHRYKTATRIIRDLFDKGCAVEISGGKKYRYTIKSLWVCIRRHFEENDAGDYDE